MENEGPSGEPGQDIPEEIEINDEDNMGTEDESIEIDNSESESSPSGGYDLVYYLMRVKL